MTLIRFVAQACVNLDRFIIRLLVTNSSVLNQSLVGSWCGFWLGVEGAEALDAGEDVVS